MEIRHIEYFLAVVDHGNVVNAARELDIAQPTLSQAVKALERDLGTPLFHRTERGLTPTAEGRALVGPGRRLMRNALSWPDALAPDTDELHGRLDLAVFPSLADSVLELLARFLERHPRIELRLSDMRHDQPWSADIVRSGRVDGAIVHLPAPDDSFAVLPLGEQSYVAVYPPGTELPPEPVDLAALPDHPMVFVPEAHTLTRDVARTMRSRGVRPRVTTLTEHRETLIPLVRAGLGGAIVDRRMVAPHDDLVVRPVFPAVTRAYGLIYEPTRCAPVFETFLDVARESVPADPGTDSTVIAPISPCRAAGPRSESRLPHRSPTRGR